MGKTRCFLCGSDVENEEFDINETFTIFSKTKLLNFLQSYARSVDNDIFSKTLTNNRILICNTCYSLMNELDNIQIRAKAIQDQLNMYLESNVRLKDILHKDEPKLKEEDEIFDVNLLEEQCEDVSAENDIQGIFKCSDCAKVYQCSKELTNHLATHNNKQRFICEICGQAYKRQKALDIHVGMHNGINPFTCTYCNKSFTQKGALVRHMPIHTGQKPYQCDLCGKRFVHHTSFNMHRLSHTGEKSHKCDICGIHFMSGSHLKRHLKVHTGEKRFGCSACGKQFAEKYNLVAHEKLHSASGSERKKFQCQICGKVYNRQTKLEEHVFMTHEKSSFIPCETDSSFIEPTEFKVN